MSKPLQQVPLYRVIILALVIVGVGGSEALAATERARITWDQATDIDLHVYDSSGNHAWYADTGGIPNATLSVDDTTGFGPETFTDEDSPSTRTFCYSLHYFGPGEAEGSPTTSVDVTLRDPDGGVRNLQRQLDEGETADLGSSPEGAEACGDTGNGPVAQDDEILTVFDAELQRNLLANDSDPNGDPLTLVDYTQPSGGSVSCEANGDCLFDPAPGFSGGTTFSYTVSDGSTTATAQVAAGTEAFLTANDRAKAKKIKTKKAAKRIRKACKDPLIDCVRLPNGPPPADDSSARSALNTSALGYQWRRNCNYQGGGDHGHGYWQIQVKAYETIANTGVDKFKIQWRDQASAWGGRWATSATWTTESVVIPNANSVKSYFGWWRQPTPGPLRSWTTASTSYYYRTQIRVEFINVRFGPDENYSLGWQTICNGQPALF